jgi:hypothetical protein
LVNVARIRSLLWLTAALGAAGAAGAWVAAAWPLPASAVSEQAAPAAASTPTPQLDVPPLEDFASAWRTALRRPLSDPPPPVAAAPPPAAPPNLMVRLIGTIVDGRRPRGVFLVGLAAIEVKGVGEKAGGAEILRIGENDATLSFNGESFVLKRQKHPFDPDGGSPEPAAARSETSTP